MPIRVLLVEDEPDIARLLRMTLEAPRYAVTAVETLAEARSALAGGPDPDLVVLDVVLPDGDGLDLCAEIKTNRPKVPVLIFTAQLFGGTRRRALENTADAFIEKPFRLEEMEAAVERLTARAARTRPAEQVDLDLALVTAVPI